MANTQTANLVSLPGHLQSDTGLTSHIASRYHINQPVTTLSSQAYISVNTYTSSSKGPNGGKEGSAMGAAEELAQRIWSRLGSRQENQAAVFLGETGSGKTTIRSHLLSNLLQYSSKPRNLGIGLTDGITISALGLLLGSDFGGTIELF